MVKKKKTRKKRRMRRGGNLARPTSTKARSVPPTTPGKTIKKGSIMPFGEGWGRHLSLKKVNLGKEEPSKENNFGFLQLPRVTGRDLGTYLASLPKFSEKIARKEDGSKIKSLFRAVNMDFPMAATPFTPSVGPRGKSNEGRKREHRVLGMAPHNTKRIRVGGTRKGKRVKYKTKKKKTRKNGRRKQRGGVSIHIAANAPGVVGPDPDPNAFGAVDGVPHNAYEMATGLPDDGARAAAQAAGYTVGCPVGMGFGACVQQTAGWWIRGRATLDKIREVTNFITAAAAGGGGGGWTAIIMFVPRGDPHGRGAEGSISFVPMDGSDPAFPFLGRVGIDINVFRTQDIRTGACAWTLPVAISMPLIGAAGALGNVPDVYRTFYTDDSGMPRENGPPWLPPCEILLPPVGPPPAPPGLHGILNDWTNCGADPGSRAARTPINNNGNIASRYFFWRRSRNLIQLLNHNVGASIMGIMARGNGVGGGGWEGSPSGPAGILGPAHDCYTANNGAATLAPAPPAPPGWPAVMYWDQHKPRWLANDVPPDLPLAWLGPPSAVNLMPPLAAGVAAGPGPNLPGPYINPLGGAIHPPYRQAFWPVPRSCRGPLCPRRGAIYPNRVNYGFVNNNGGNITFNYTTDEEYQSLACITHHWDAFIQRYVSEPPAAARNSIRTDPQILKNIVAAKPPPATQPPANEDIGAGGVAATIAAGLPWPPAPAPLGVRSTVLTRFPGGALGDLLQRGCRRFFGRQQMSTVLKEIEQKVKEYDNYMFSKGRLTELAGFRQQNDWGINAGPGGVNYPPTDENDAATAQDHSTWTIGRIRWGDRAAVDAHGVPDSPGVPGGAPPLIPNMDSPPGNITWVWRGGSTYVSPVAAADPLVAGPAAVVPFGHLRFHPAEPGYYLAAQYTQTSCTFSRTAQFAWKQSIPATQWQMAIDAGNARDSAPARAAAALDWRNAIVAGYGANPNPGGADAIGAAFYRIHPSAGIPHVVYDETPLESIYHEDEVMWSRRCILRLMPPNVHIGNNRPYILDNPAIINSGGEVYRSYPGPGITEGMPGVPGNGWPTVTLVRTGESVWEAGHGPDTANPRARRARHVMFIEALLLPPAQMVDYIINARDDYMLRMDGGCEIFTPDNNHLIQALSAPGADSPGESLLMHLLHNQFGNINAGGGQPATAMVMA